MPAQLRNAVSKVARAQAFGPVVVAIILYLFFLLVSLGSGFFGVAGTASWLDTTADLGIVAMPVALLMIAGEFDLSVGSMVGGGSITVGLLTGFLSLPLWVSVIAGSVLGVLVGLLNGFLVTRTKLPSFIVTLGTNFIVLGVGITVGDAVMHSTIATVETSGWFSELFKGKIAGFDVSVIWWILVVLVAAWVLRKSRYGNWIMATGGDAEKARRSGVLTSRVKIILFVCTSVAASFVGMLEAVKFGTGDPTSGSSFVFEAPIVAVLGGVLLTGGYGSILGVVFGLLIYGISNAGLFYAGWDVNLTQVVLGGLLLIAVLSNNRLRQIALAPIRAARKGSTK
jgi:simple sugar transport system permease protein